MIADRLRPRLQRKTLHALDATGMTPPIGAVTCRKRHASTAIPDVKVLGTSPEIEALQGRYFHWALLRLGNVEPMLNTAYDAGERPAVRDAPPWSGHADTCLYTGGLGVDAAYAWLMSKGMALAASAVAPYAMKQIFLHDPNHYIRCFQQPV